MKNIFRFLVLLLLPIQVLAALTASVTLDNGQPGSVLPSESTALKITLSNSSTAASIANVTFNSSLPAGFPDGLKISSAATYQCTDPFTSTSSAGSGALTAAIGTQAINLSGGVIPARANNTDGICTIVIPVIAGSTTGNSATYTYQIAGGAVTGNDGGAVSNSGAVSQSINVLALSKPTISKTFSTSTVRLGGNPSTLTITLNNSNAIAIKNFTITDTFPSLSGTPIIKVAGTPAATASCNNGGPAPTFIPSAGDVSVTATGTIPARSGAVNGSCTITVKIEANSTNGAFSTGSQINRINKSTDFTNDIGIPAAADATSNITVQSPLTVTKVFAHPTLSSGEADSFTITLNNAANAPLTIGSFSDNPIDGHIGTGGGAGVLGSGLVATGGSTTCGGSVNLVNAGDGIALAGSNTIPANGSCTITVNFTAAAQTTQIPITYTNTIAEGAVVIGSSAGIVSQSRSASVLVADTLRVLKTASPLIAAPGNPVKYAVTVQNFSNTAINNVTINDVLPTSVSYLTGIINGNDFNPSLSVGCGALTETSGLGSSSAQFTVATLPARINVNTPAACTVTFWAMVDPAAGNNVSTVNTISSGQVCYNVGATCNGTGVSSSPNTATTATVFSATKRFNNTTSTVTLSEGTIAKLSITLNNLSANPLTNVSLTDTFPIDATTGGQLQVASPANASTTCGGSITAVDGTTSLSLNGGTVPARANNGLGASGSCVINVDVIGPAGTYDNQATLEATQTYANNTSALTGNITTNTARLVYLSSLGATKSFTPATVASGGHSRVAVRLSNSGNVALTHVAVTDPLPTGMVLADPVNASTSCAGAPVFASAVAGASSITMQGASIAGLGSCDVLFDVIATGGSDWINTIPSGNISADGGVRNVSAVSATLTHQAASSISVSKATSPSTLTFPGETSVLTITFTNGNTNVTGMGVVDYFTVDGTSSGTPNGMAIAATPNISTTCPGGVVSAIAGGKSVGISGVTSVANGTCSLSVNVTSSTVGGITNVIPISVISTDQGITNTGIASTSLTTQSNIGVVKQFTPNVVKPGERSRLRITFFNPTIQAMADVAVIDTLPTGVTVPSSPNPTTTCTGATVTVPTVNQVQISGGNIIASTGTTAESCYAEIDVFVATQGEYINTIPAGDVTATAGGKPVKNSQPTSDTLLAKAPLKIHKAFKNKTLDVGNPDGFTTGSAAALPGASAILTIRLDNPNTQALTGTALTDVLPSHLVIAQTPNASTTCSGGFVDALASSTSLRLTGATIPASGSCTVSVDVLSNISGSYVNTIAANDVTTNEGVTNGEPTSAELIISTPPGIDKQFTPAVIPAGGTSTLTIVFKNDNNQAITLTSAFVDTLPTAPGNIVVASTPNIGGTCSLGSVTANAGAGTVSYANGATIPAGGCTINVDVTGSTAGEYINNIPAGDLKTSVGNNQQPANSTLLISPLGFISGKVFQDNNVTPNGSFDSGVDTPITGVSIELHSGTDCSASLTAVTGVVNPVTTDSLGNYLFPKLPAGTYSVCETVQPSGTDNGPATAGPIISVNGSTGTPGAASNPTATSSQIIAITLNGDGGSSEISGSANNNFAEIVPSRISGMVFRDENNNGIQNGADTGLSGITIELLNNAGSVIATTATDTNGAYSFTGLAPATYSVREPTQPVNTANGLTIAGAVANGGTVGIVTSVTTLPSKIANITLPPNTISMANNFAEIPNGRRISGSVFLDFDNNGVINGPDHGIGGQTINLTGTDINGNSITLSITTTNDGAYNFIDVPEGNYIVTQPNQPTGTINGLTIAGSAGGTITGVAVTPSAISAIPLTGANTVSGDNNFAEVPNAAVDLAVTKTHSPSSFGEGSSTNFYTISSRNIGTLASSGTITIVDTLPVGITAFAWPTTGAWVCTVSSQVVTCNSGQIIAANGGVASDIVLRVAVANGLAGQILTNKVDISGGNEPLGFDGNNHDEDFVTVAQSATVGGHVWRDLNHNRVLDGGEPVVAGWNVELLLNGQLILSTNTDVNGKYSFTGLAPGAGYRVKFKEPITGAILGVPVPNENGVAFINDVVDSIANPAGANNINGSLNNLTLVAGTNTQEQSLPLDPTGVIYDSITRQPVAGATIQLLNGGSPVNNSCLIGANNPQTTGGSGYYQFLLINPAPSGCPGDGVYTLQVVQPAGYLPPESTIIPATTGPYTPTNGGVDTIQTQAGPPTDTQATTYYFDFNLTLNSSSAVVNNHIPLDPILEGAITVTKTTPKKDVVRGELVPYTITARNTLSATLTNIALQDQIPAGFKYVDGSATIDGIKADPVVNGRSLTWPNQTFSPTGNAANGDIKTIQLILIIGSGVGEGNYVNQAWANNTVANARVSNIGTATVRVIPDPLFDCSDLIGKVFDDKNRNGYQDEGEPGLAGVRVATPRGLLVTTDDYGRFHITCADVPNELHGSNFIMKLDERTLPSGYRVTTENPRVVRLTRGKLVKLNFGAALHRVLRVDIDRTAFSDDGKKLTTVASDQLNQLIDILKQQPSQVRLSYGLAEGEEKSDAQARMQVLTKQLEKLWQQCDCNNNYALTVEQEVIMHDGDTTVWSTEGRVSP